MANAHVAT